MRNRLLPQAARKNNAASACCEPLAEASGCPRRTIFIQMPTYHFTFHAYRAWRADNPRGYVKRGEGVVPPNPVEAASWGRQAKRDAVLFNNMIQSILIRGAKDICDRRQWILEGVGTDLTHLHLVISWDGFLPCDEVLAKLKNVLSYLLGKWSGKRGKRWFGRYGDWKVVNDADHLEYLVGTYFPDHRGLCWRGGQGLPEIPTGIL